jgi:hypothetical protein
MFSGEERGKRSKYIRKRSGIGKNEEEIYRGKCRIDRG